MSHVITENYQLIQFAEVNGVVVRNSKGERVRVTDNYPDAVKCYVSGLHYYLSSAEKQEGLTFDGLSYEEWKSKPLELNNL